MKFAASGDQLTKFGQIDVKLRPDSDTNKVFGELDQAAADIAKRHVLGNEVGPGLFDKPPTPGGYGESEFEGRRDGGGFELFTARSAPNAPEGSPPVASSLTKLRTPEGTSVELGFAKGGSIGQLQVTSKAGTRYWLSREGDPANHEWRDSRTGELRRLAVEVNVASGNSDTPGVKNRAAEIGVLDLDIGGGGKPVNEFFASDGRTAPEHVLAQYRPASESAQAWWRAAERRSENADPAGAKAENGAGLEGLGVRPAETGPNGGAELLRSAAGAPRLESRQLTGAELAALLGPDDEARLGQLDKLGDPNARAELERLRAANIAPEDAPWFRDKVKVGVTGGLALTIAIGAALAAYRTYRADSRKNDEELDEHFGR